jgi:hypothetical protein
MSGQSQGAFSRLAMDAVLPFDTSSEPYNFLTEDLVADRQLIDDGDENLRGTRSHLQDRVNDGPVFVGGPINMNPTPEELDDLFPRILGAAAVGNVFSLAETVPAFQVMIDRVAKVHTYTTCYVNRAIFSGRKGKPIRLQLQIIGTDESEASSGSFPVITDSVEQPYVFNEGVLTLISATRLFDRFILVIDNRLEREFNNSLTATDITAADRGIFLATSTPYTSDETTLYTTPVGSVAGTAGTLVFTKGAQSTTFTFANLKSFPRSPSVVRGKRQIRLPLRYKAFETANTKELEVTHVA